MLQRLTAIYVQGIIRFGCTFRSEIGKLRQQSVSAYIPRKISVSQHKKLDQLLLRLITTDLKWRHFGCYAHTVNLIVNDSLNLIQDTLSKVSKIVSHFRKSANAKNKLDIVQRQQGKEPKKLVKDVPTRWNSTYLMQNRFLELEEAIRTTLALIDGESLPVIPTEEWKFMKELVIVLKLFYDVMELMSAEKYVTLSLVIIVTNSLENVYSEMWDSSEFGNLSKNFIGNIK
ncbi:hypothetical protein NQ314_012677 [Rhamnusium bicolor]|uniref:Uncharacterized protein n=1 Tax=Rhamnusium bicolor TaxID=1586634 RepID=A0AAV8XCF5_9CUCU|nr:hypothetical protein NQ314_012677 [Rhamnusium bicolor]